jgi:hypothetical protein
MTLRALIIGFVSALFIASAGFVNDWVFQLTMIAGNHFPISVFGLTLVVVLTLNPLLHRIRPAWRLGSSELAVIMALMLVACSIPGSGLMRTFAPTLALPVHLNEGVNRSAWGARPEWGGHGVLSLAPKQMLVNDGQYDASIGGFVTGKRGIGLQDVPWDAWAKPLQVWLPLILLIGLSMIAMSLIVHRQWSQRERLRYPIAEVAKAIISQDSGSFGPMFRNKAFWIGLGAIFVLHLVNGWYQLSAGASIQIPLKFEFGAIGQAFPRFAKAEQAHYLTAPTLYPTVVAFAFFLASDVGLSLGLSQWFWVFAMMAAPSLDIDVSRDWVTGGAPDYQRFGSYLGIALLLLYMGRRHYWDMLKAALLPWVKSAAEAVSVWACRLLLVALTCIVLILTWLGLDWPLAILFTLLVMMLFLVMARLSAEAGLFFNQPWWHPLGVLFGLLGAAALGPEAVIIMGMIVMVMIIDPRESLMPFVVNGLKICDDMKVRPARVGWSAGVVFALALAVATPTVLWACYNYGAPEDTWGKDLAKKPFDQAAKMMSSLAGAGELRSSMEREGIERITNIRPDSRFLWAAPLGLGLVAVVSLMRLRYTWWPLHPILFLVWGTYPMGNFSSSFLLGWLIKALITKLGGGARYRGTIPLMLGIIAGDLLGGLLWMGHGAAYFGLEGSKPPTGFYKILPG